MSSAIVLGQYQLPVWAANYLVDEDESVELSEEQEFNIESWLDSLAGSNHNFAITSDKPENVPYSLFDGSKTPSVTVVVSGFWTNIDKLSHALALDESGTIEKLQLAKEKTISGEISFEQTGLISQKAIVDLLKDFPETASKKTLMHWLQFGHPINQIWAVIALEYFESKDNV